MEPVLETCSTTGHDTSVRARQRLFSGPWRENTRYSMEILSPRENNAKWSMTLQSDLTMFNSLSAKALPDPSHWPRLVAGLRELLRQLTQCVRAHQIAHHQRHNVDGNFRQLCAQPGHMVFFAFTAARKKFARVGG